MTFSEKNGVLHADNIPLPQIAKKFGTPTYVYSADVIRAQFDRLNNALKSVLPKNKIPMLCYACKASSNIAILKLLNNLGAGLEIVSEGELVRGRKAGFDASKIVSTGVGKQRGEIESLIAAGVHQINVESLPELELINSIAGKMKKTPSVVLRFNPNVKGGGHNKITTGRKQDKFGLLERDLFTGFKMAKGFKNIKLLGISMHIGSQVFTVQSFKKAFERLPSVVRELRAQGHAITRLDIGGGFPILYKDEKMLDLDAYARWVRDIILPLETEIILEPGRFLVGNAGVLLSEVLFVKESGGRKFLILDAAMNDLIRPTLYEAYHAIEPTSNRRRKKQTYDITGPVCETGDMFASGRVLPTMNQGEYAVIKSAGAYGFCMASNYNSRPMAAEIMVDGGKVALIRKRQSFDDLMAAEAIPAWLK
jgi:diaminopimelate decarboxylase